MPVTHNRQFTRDNGDIVEVDFEITSIFTSSMEIAIKDSWLFKDCNNVNAPSVTLSDKESDRFESEVALNLWDYVE